MQTPSSHRTDGPEEVLNIALAQVRCSDGDTGRNTDRALEAIKQAAELGADIVLFPELYLTGILEGKEQLAAASEPREGAYLQRILQASKRHHVGVAMSFVEKAERYHNTTMLTDKAGAPLAFYRKTHLWLKENEMLARGETIGEPVAFEGARLGLLTCYDIEFPEPARHLALHGAQCILVPTANMMPWGSHQRISIIARALENHVFVAYCNRADCGSTYVHTGDSAIVDPFGRLVCDLGARPMVGSFAVDFSVCAGSRMEMGPDYFRDRRPELYADLATPAKP
jgi:5-aminopentanamidase